MNEVITSESWYDAQDNTQKKTQIERDPQTGQRYKIIYRWCLCGGGSWIIEQTTNI